MGCQAEKKHLELHRQLFALDNTDPSKMVARYHFDEEVIPLSDKSFKGAVVFRSEDFESWINDLEGQCKEWVGFSPLISPGK